MTYHDIEAVLFGVRQHILRGIGQPYVIAVEKCDLVRRTVSGAGVARGRDASVDLLAQERDVLALPFDDAGQLVCVAGMIIDDHDLGGRMGLGDRAVQRVSD